MQVLAHFRPIKPNKENKLNSREEKLRCKYCISNGAITKPLFIERDITKAAKKAKTNDGIPSFLVNDIVAVLAKPLCQIVNTSISIGVYPECWKIDKVCPI